MQKAISLVLDTGTAMAFWWDEWKVLHFFFKRLAWNIKVSCSFFGVTKPQLPVAFLTEANGICKEKACGVLVHFVTHTEPTALIVNWTVHTVHSAFLPWRKKLFTTGLALTIFFYWLYYMPISVGMELLVLKSRQVKSEGWWKLSPLFNDLYLENWKKQAAMVNL